MILPLGAKLIIEKCTYNPNLVWINKIQKIFICVLAQIQQFRCRYFLLALIRPGSFFGIVIIVVFLGTGSVLGVVVIVVP